MTYTIYTLRESEIEEIAKDMGITKDLTNWEKYGISEYFRKKIEAKLSMDWNFILEEAIEEFFEGEARENQLKGVITTI